ncbi:DUF6691 family protein [Nereida sp. MMG025]|uniref:DUF6691 family protein n=1 Tax=Nereida sp. MMG025 TaxID=2909981 RepID=UPI001F42D5AD|nr:DUF6691 family protein [Nereida sp. MMG025]MCF6443706.1 hypothetical protein [Nereida sp. MMG025]
MIRLVFAVLAGGLFGAGLLVSGMTDTRKVQGWLDLFGNWDPTLAFVMGGAIVPMAAAWLLSKGRTPSLGGTFPAAAPTVFDRPFVMGSVLFGVGWGLAGLCPGPALASLSFGGTSGLVFFAALVAGFAVAPPVRRTLDGPAKAA